VVRHEALHYRRSRVAWKLAHRKEMVLTAIYTFLLFNFLVSTFKTGLVATLSKKLAGVSLDILKGCLPPRSR
jgi:hypothetical protein